MLTKPIMVTAPLVVVIYDWVFSRRFRWKFYAGLALTWLALGWALLSGANDWERSAGYGYKGITPMTYAMSQPSVILHYLRLFVWPYPLCLDYRWPAGFSLGATVVIIGLLVGTVWLFWRKPEAGFVGLFLWLTLAPSSSFIPIGDLAFEHRMYLPLVSLALLVALGGWALLERGRVAAVVAVIAALCVTTSLRNADYSSALALWKDTVARAPHNGRAHENLGKAYEEEGQRLEALREYAAAVQYDPTDARTRYNLATALAQLNKLDGAIDEFKAAVTLSPDYAVAHYNLGLALIKSGQVAAGQAELQEAGRLDPRLRAP
jgi:tetratricopeptide (TPR) repeat protein